MVAVFDKVHFRSMVYQLLDHIVVLPLASPVQGRYGILIPGIHVRTTGYEKTGHFKTVLAAFD